MSLVLWNARTPTTVKGTMVTEGARRTGSQAVERALGLLRSFEVGPPARSLSELAQLTGLTPATAHRLLRALCCAELLAHDPLTERYGLGVALVPLGSRAADALASQPCAPCSSRSPPQVASRSTWACATAARCSYCSVCLRLKACASIRAQVDVCPRTPRPWGRSYWPSIRSERGCPGRTKADQAHGIDHHLPFGAEPRP